MADYQVACWIKAPQSGDKQAGKNMQLLFTFPCWAVNPFKSFFLRLSKLFETFAQKMHLLTGGMKTWKWIFLAEKGEKHLIQIAAILQVVRPHVWIVTCSFSVKHLDTDMLQASLFLQHQNSEQWSWKHKTSPGQVSEKRRHSWKKIHFVLNLLHPTQHGCFSKKQRTCAFHVITFFF